MAKSKKQNASKPKEEKAADVPFDLEAEISKINPFLREGFSRFLLGIDVKDLNDFKKYYEEYTGEEYK